MMDLGALPNGPFSNGVGINNKGQVVGAGLDAVGRFQALLYQGGTVTSLPTLGGDRTTANDINDLVQIVGLSETSSGLIRAVLWTK
jgi:probable HAF family extracellular repeat protein